MAYSKFKQGQYRLINTSKYRGHLPIVYRSSWEYTLMSYLDQNAKIQYWGSESVIVPYYCPVAKKMRQYVVDFYFTYVDKSGKTRKILVEVKPYAQTVAPVKGKKREITFLREMMVYANNMAKWAAAKKYAERMGFDFVLMSEKDLNIR